jgi:AmmeMemoRadiSam system protein B/AmmeMemoRadiSam system protein A
LAACGEDEPRKPAAVVVQDPTGRSIEAKPVEAPEPHRVRPAALAGAWYPGDADALAREVGGHLDAAPEWTGPAPIAVVAPHAGFRYSAAIQGNTYRAVRGRRYGRVFVLAVPHRAQVRGVSIPDVTHYETPLGRVPLDRKAADRLLAASPMYHTRRDAHSTEHSAEIQLPFLQRSIDDLFIVPMLVGVTPQYAHAAASVLRQELKAGDLVVVSSDSNHYGNNYGYRPFPCDGDVEANLKRLDMGAVELMLGLDLEGFAKYRHETGIKTCGFSPICVLLALLPEGAKGEVLGYDTSGRQGGDFRSSVSYVGVAYTGSDWGGELSSEEEAFALRLARESLTRWVEKGERFDPVAAGWEVPEDLRVKSGVFVTYRKNGDLRGCIGDILPARMRFEAIVARAISSASEDSRFPAVTKEEIGDIEIEISVLTPPRPVAGPEEIRLGRDGILLHYDGRMHAVYLPQVAPEQGWTLEETLTHLSRKGGLAPGTWRTDRVSFKTFEAEVFSEDD